MILTSSNAKDDSSFCNATGTYAKLVLVMDLGDDVMEPPVMVFEFNGVSLGSDGVCIIGVLGSVLLLVTLPIYICISLVSGSIGHYIL